MKQESTSPHISTARAEAAAWVARLHSSGRTRALEAGLRKWLKAAPEHAQAFEIATEAWEIGGSVPGAAVPRMADPFQERKPKLNRQPYFALAAALTVAVIGGLFYVSRPDSAVTTNVGEQRMLTLDDGTRIFLNTGTRLFVEEDATRRRVRLENGEAMFDVAKDPRRPFVVTAGDNKVVALGTSFVVRRDEQQLTVTLVEGRVAVSPVSATAAETGENSGLHPSGKGPAVATILTPGQRLTVVNRKPPKLDEPAIENVTAWLRGEIILDNTPLQDAVTEMNRYSAVKLSVDNAAAADIRVSGIFRAGDSARFAQAVGETYHLAVEQQPRRILISGSSD
ncbi:MAG TPA: FecR domain-containing protein [Steroidobacteraceae bacterium]|nr:FecR domain-containing protein [Steroidobacteraceae bacterium]